MKDLKYTDILKANKVLGEDVSAFPPYEVKVLSNIITSQFNDVFEYVLRSQRINAKVSSGEYDNIVQDSERHSSADCIILFWEVANLVDGLQYKADTMDAGEIDRLIGKTKSEIDFVLQNLSKTATVILNKFTTQVFNHAYLKENAFDRIARALNEHIATNLPANVTVIDVEKVLARLSIEKSVDWRYYYSSKSLYSVEFYKEYAGYVSPVILSVLGQTRKAIVFDCDNTLWKGVIGEDGLDGIVLSPKDKGGSVFEEVHHLAKALSRQGTLIGLCSKNNPEDVEEVFLKRGDMALRTDDIVIRKVNWKDKAANLSEIAGELNIGIDSIVFVDDSSFEVNLVRENIPAVTTLQVPERLHDYPSMLRGQSGLFYKKEHTKEDAARVALYKTEQNRKDEQSKFSSIDDYLRSLELKIEVVIDDAKHIQRLAQLTQKTNQFNFTTRRYSVAEMEQFIAADNYRVYAFDVADKFGDYGLTGMAIVRKESKVAVIDTFLMSCRVLGRNIETAFLNFVLKSLLEEGVGTVRAEYLRTPKNAQVESFYDAFGFALKSEQAGKKEYQLVLKDQPFHIIDFITIKIANQHG